MAALECLVVWFCRRRTGGQRTRSGRWRCSLWLREPLVCQSDFYVHCAYQLQHLAGYVEVVVEEILPSSFLKERANVVGVVVEEGRHAIGGREGLPVHMTPVAVVADNHLTHGTLAATRRLGQRDGHGQRLHTVGTDDVATVAHRLTTVHIRCVYPARAGGDYRGIPVRRREERQYSSVHFFFGLRLANPSSKSARAS